MRELGVDFLVDRDIADLLVGEGHPGYPAQLAADVARGSAGPAALLALLRRKSSLAAKLERGPSGEAILRAARLLDAIDADRAVEDDLAPWARALHPLIEELLGDAPYHLEVPVGVQMRGAGLVVRLLAAARQSARRLWRPEEPIPLAAELRPRPEVPFRGAGGITVVEIGVPAQPLAAAAHLRVPPLLGPLAPEVRWGFLHGPDPADPHAMHVAAVLEALRERAPADFWSAADHLATRAGLLLQGPIEAALRHFPVDAAAVLARAESPEIQALVCRDVAQLRACGVPPLRPAFAVDKRALLGIEQAWTLSAVLAAR